MNKQPTSKNHHSSFKPMLPCVMNKHHTSQKHRSSTGQSRYCCRIISGSQCWLPPPLGRGTRPKFRLSESPSPWHGTSSIGGQASELCRIFKPGKNTENKTLEFQSRKVGDGIEPFKLRVILREFVKLSRKGGVFSV